MGSTQWTLLSTKFLPFDVSLPETKFYIVLNLRFSHVLIITGVVAKQIMQPIQNLHMSSMWWELISTQNEIRQLFAFLKITCFSYHMFNKRLPRTFNKTFEIIEKILIIFYLRYLIPKKNLHWKLPGNETTFVFVFEGDKILRLNFVGRQFLSFKNPGVISTKMNCKISKNTFFKAISNKQNNYTKELQEF